jgi:glucosylceramidase
MSKDKTRADGEINVWQSRVNSSNTGMDQALEPQAGEVFTPDSGPTLSNTIAVDETDIYQTMDGFGASITEASAHLYQSALLATEKTPVLQALFGKSNGIGISMLRQTIGACDHCVAPYTFAPNEQTEDLPYFDFSHELLEILPTVQDVLAVEPNRVIIMASSWSPPGWMKANDSELGMYNDIRGSLLPNMYQAYANYLVKFVQEYEARGIHIFAITPTNEPDHASYDWPALPMTVEEERNLVMNYLYDTLAANNLDTKIICWDHSYTTTNYPDGQFPLQYFTSQNAFDKTAGTAWHWYEGDEETMSVVKKAYPTKDHWFTEGSGGEWEFPKWRVAFLNQCSCIINITRNWCKSVIYWNLALDQNGAPDYYYVENQGQHSTNRGLITINSDDGSWFPNVDYYTLGHVSKFVDPGSVRIGSTSLDGNLESVAFKNPDGSKVLVLVNLTAQAQEAKILWGNDSFTYEISAETLVTFVWEGNQNGKTLQPIWFNNLEDNTNYVAGNNSTVTDVTSTANIGGTTGVALTTTENGDPGEDSQCVIIRPQNGTTMDVSGYQYLTFSVCDNVNPTGATIRVTFVDNDDNTVSIWSHERTLYYNWTRIWVHLAGAQGFDKTALKEIRIGFWWSGSYYIDDLAFCLGYSDGIPTIGQTNYVVNPSFEDDGSATPNPTGWTLEGAEQGTGYLESGSGTYSNAPFGRYYLVHHAIQPFSTKTWQLVEGLPNGTYLLQATVGSLGNQIQSTMTAKDFGGNDMSVAFPTSGTNWTTIQIANIVVTNGQCLIEFTTADAIGEGTSFIDAVRLYRTGNTV